MTSADTGPAHDLAASVRQGDRRASEVVAEALAAIARRDHELSAFVEVWPETALAQAAAIDRERAAGRPLGPLAGVPFAIKDNLLLAGQKSACGSRMLDGFTAPYSATTVARLIALGAVPVGRTNMDEFGMGSSTEHSAFGPTRNPWDPARVPGGSSGGAGAAVATGFVPLALGSDTGGSVRQPASLCGVTGLKPTYGRLSRHGLVAYASSLDCVGILARSAADIALALRIAGADPEDATSSDRPVPDYEAALAERTGLQGLRIGLPDELHGEGIDAEVAAAVAAAGATLQSLGARSAPVSLPALEHAVATYYLVAAAEASSNLARYDGVRYGLQVASAGGIDALYARSRSAGFGSEVQLRILLGTFALQHGYQDEVYGQATRVRALLRTEFARAFAGCDLIACATAPTAAFPLGSKIADPLAMYRCDALTVPASLAGLPAISVPCGFTRGGLPIGVQWIAPAFREDLLLQVAHCFQRATDWHRREVPR